MNIKAVVLHRINMELVSPFVTSYGAYSDRESIIVQVIDEHDEAGWGECVAFATPWYTEETVQGAWDILQQFLIPVLLENSISHPKQLSAYWTHIKRHHMAKASLEMAVWDLYAKTKGIPLYKLIGGTRDEIHVGVAIGLQPSLDHYRTLIDSYVEQGYRRMKIKIKPGEDVSLVAALRQCYPHLPLMVDANSAYTLQDVTHLKQLDQYQLMMIEQPLGADDIVDHAALQRAMETPICLDESIVSADDVRKALQLDSGRIINVKLGRVGGWNEALRIHELCLAHQVPLWCGGMLETGIGRAHNMALATLPGFTIPGDISASARYWERDIIKPEVEVNRGKLCLSQLPGIGVEIDQSFMASLTTSKRVISKS